MLTKCFLDIFQKDYFPFMKILIETSFYPISFQRSNFVSYVHSFYTTAIKVVNTVTYFISIMLHFSLLISLFLQWYCLELRLVMLRTNTVYYNTASDLKIVIFPSSDSCLLLHCKYFFRCLDRPYHLKFFKGCLLQIFLGSFLNILTQIFLSF